jgi:NTP pyrophosphatase (non-canonical NTP hydrolase)
MTIHQLQQEVDLWIKTNGVRYFSELTNTALLAEECGEVSRLMARMYGDQSFKSSAHAIHAKESLASELADVLFVLTCLANQCDINLEQSIIQNMELKKNRDKDRHHSNPKLK